MKKIFIFGLISMLFYSCKNDNKVENVERAFYYWKSDNSLNSETENKLNANKVNKIYVKFFEIDYSEATGNYPYDKLYSYGTMFENIENLSIVPTIFIKNEIFKYNSEKDLDKLSDNIVFLINKRCGEKFKNAKLTDEIQIDCDWTKSTKEKYFYLLKKIKEDSKKKISCTLRLYPYKYQEKMGVPPVDKAMLMCYNLVKPLTNSNKNSILDINELKSYLNEKRSYPIHLDVALPVFSWSQLYQNNHFQKLINIRSIELSGFTKEIKPMWYEVTKDTSFSWDNYYRIGDQIKCEEVSTKTINESIAIIKKNVILDKNTTIALFDLDNSIFTKYTDEEISSFYSTFSK
jgi:hypothetical protein